MRSTLTLALILLVGCSGAESSTSGAEAETATTSVGDEPAAESAAPVTCEAVDFELGEPVPVGEPREPNDEDPVSAHELTLALSLRYRCGAEERTQALPPLSVSCHGAGCAATVTIRGEETRVEDPDGTLTEREVASVRDAIPERAGLTLAVVTLAERGFAELTTFDVVTVDGGFDVQRRGDGAPEVLARVRPDAT